MGHLLSRITLLSTAALMLHGAGATASAQVQWRRDYNTARQESEQKGLPLVIDFGTDNCFWCKRLDATTFIDPTVAKVMNERFIPLKINASHEYSLAQALQISSYPTIVMATSDGRILNRIVGYKDAPSFQRILQTTLASLPKPKPRSAVASLERKPEPAAPRVEEPVAPAPPPPPPPVVASAPDWMQHDYDEAANAVAGSDYARAIAFLKGIIRDGENRPVQAKARQMLGNIEQQAAGRLAHAKNLQDRGMSTDAINTVTDLMSAYPGTQAAADAGQLLNVLASKPDVKTQHRSRRARTILAQAKQDYRTKQYLCCLDRCELLASGYADLPEGIEGIELGREIKSNPERMELVCEKLSNRLGQHYLDLAETWLAKGNTDQAAHYLNRVIESFPGSRQAEAAQMRMPYLKGQPTLQVDFQESPHR